MTTVTKHYKQQPYGDQYTIEYRWQSDDTCKLFCWEHPYNPYSTEVAKCHLYSDGQICVSSSFRVDTWDKAKAIVTSFIDGYSQYVRTGVFPNGAKTVNV